MSVRAEVTERVGRVIRLLREDGGVSSADDGNDITQAEVDEYAHRGLLRKGGSGTGDGWEIDSEVAAAMGLTEFDDS